MLTTFKLYEIWIRPICICSLFLKRLLQICPKNNYVECRCFWTDFSIQNVSMYLLDVFSRLALAKRNTAAEKRKLKKIKRPRPKNKTPNFRPQMVSILNISSLSFQMTITLHGKTTKDQKKDTKSTWFSFKRLFFSCHFCALSFPARRWVSTTLGKWLWKCGFRHIA